MGSNLSFILSLFFVIQIMLMGGDLLNLQTINGELTNIASYVTNMVQKDGKITNLTYEYILDTYRAELQCLENCEGRFKDTLKFKVEKTYNAMCLGNKEITLSVTRSVVVGYYD